MKRMGLGVALLLAVACGGAQGEWIAYRHTETGFRIRFPSAPMENLEEHSTNWGVIQTYLIDAAPAGSSLRYRVRADIYPAQLLVLGGVLDLITAREKRYELDINGRAIAQEPIRLGERVGRQYTFEHADGSLEIARIFLADVAMYQVSVFTPKDETERPEIARYFASFELPASS